MPPTASCRRWPTRSVASLAAPTTSRASGAGRFAVLLPETDEIAAINYVERVRRACELWLESGAIALRLAIGWAGTAGDPSLAERVSAVASRRGCTPSSARGAARGEAGDSAADDRRGPDARARLVQRPAVSRRPRRIPRPGVAPVCRPSSTTGSPLTMTCSMPVGKRARLVVGRVAADRRRIEDDEVGEGAVADASRAGGARAAPPAPPVILRIGLLEAEQALVAHELAEDAREAAVGPRAGLGADERRVGPDHPDRMARGTAGVVGTTGRS